MDTLLLQPVGARERARAVEHAAVCLRQGGVVAFPTETVYGLGANIFSERALHAVFRVKGRPPDNPLIVHVATPDQASELTEAIPPRAHALMEKFWPGPLTLVLRRNALVPDVVTAALDTVALRMPAHPLALALIRAAGVPLAAPSANRSGNPSPTDAAHVIAQLAGRIDVILDGGPCRVGIESTVLDLAASRPRILRPGGVTREQLEDTLRCHVAAARGGTLRPASPGMKYRHYAPAHPLLLLLPRRDEDDAQFRIRFSAMVQRQRLRGLRVGVLAPRAWKSGIDCDAFFSLESGTPADLARVMYRGLHAFDDAGVDVLCCPGVREEGGMADAVMNRLRKAASSVIR
ncbi:MAG: threonylcarbamoyl-AMP synthase [Ignavibacteriae bacterium]|nr:threonylcarbamoyl-AMP synthase [Ignavibacteriota bacterium]